MVLAFVLLSELTKAWLLYLGLVFLFMVMYAPGGIASLIMMNLRVAAFGRLQGAVGRATWRWPLTALIVLLGAAGHDRDGLSPQAQCGAGPELKFLGVDARMPHGAEQLVRLRVRHAHRAGPVRGDAPPLRARSGARSRSTSRKK